ncbi:MAG: hypothetical protein ACR2QC_04150 [Gammaproteobacteria bacterium]
MITIEQRRIISAMADGEVIDVEITAEGKQYFFRHNTSPNPRPQSIENLLGKGILALNNDGLLPGQGQTIELVFEPKS